MIIDLIPNLELAMRADARPPLPPPMTRKSVSFEMGAMMGRLVAKCRKRLDKRATGALEARTEVLDNVANACMGNALVE